MVIENAYDAMAFSQSSTALMTLFNVHTFKKFCRVPGTKHAHTKKNDIHLIAWCTCLGEKVLYQLIPRYKGD